MSTQYVVFIHEVTWRLAVVREGAVTLSPLAEAPTLPERVQQLTGELASAGYSHTPLLLALPSSWCLSASISKGQLDRGNRRKSLAFRLEEHLPISAEDFIADYRETAADTVLGVCAELARLREIVDAFMAANLPVRHLCPQALLSAAFVAARHPDAQAVFLGPPAAPSAAPCELIELAHHGPTRWSWFAQDGPSVEEHLTAWRNSPGQPNRLYALDGPPQSAALRSDAPSLECLAVPDTTAEQAAALEGARILDGGVWPWIDFRRDALAAPHQYEVYREPLRALVAALILLLVCVSLVAQWRGQRYQTLAAAQRQAQVAVFQRVFPSQRTPAVVKSRLLSERQKLLALHGPAGDSANRELSSSSSALVQLRDLLKGLPQDLRYQILELNLQPDLIRIEGQAQSHVEAERLTIALRQAGAFDVEAPKTQALREGGVSFAFVAKPRLAEPQAKGGR